jgi:hypothetical protein
MHKVIQLISNFLYNKNMPFSMKIHVHWMNLMKNQIIKRGFKTKDSFFKPFDKKIIFNGLKCLTLGVNHMCKK